MVTLPKHQSLVPEIVVNRQLLGSLLLYRQGLLLCWDAAA